VTFVNCRDTASAAQLPYAVQCWHALFHGNGSQNVTHRRQAATHCRASRTGRCRRPTMGRSSAWAAVRPAVAREDRAPRL